MGPGVKPMSQLMVLNNNVCVAVSLLELLKSKNLSNIMDQDHSVT